MTPAVLRARAPVSASPLLHTLKTTTTTNNNNNNNNSITSAHSKN